MFHFNLKSAIFLGSNFIMKIVSFDSHKFNFTGLLWKYLALYHNYRYAYGLFSQSFLFVRSAMCAVRRGRPAPRWGGSS